MTDTSCVDMPQWFVSKFRRGQDRAMVNAPWWVTRTLYPKSKLDEAAGTSGPNTELPRWQKFDTESRGYCYDRCRVSATVRNGFKNIDEGLSHLLYFWRCYKEEFEKYCLGETGITATLRDILEQMSIAWWLPDVLSLDQNCYHINRFFALSRMYTNTEAPNEQWVGALKYLYNPIKGDTTDTLTRRLRARLAGVRGEECDDAFLRKLSNSLEGAKPRRTGKKLPRAGCRVHVRQFSETGCQGGQAFVTNGFLIWSNRRNYRGSSRKKLN